MRIAKYKYWLIWEEKSYVFGVWITMWLGYSSLSNAQKDRNGLLKNPLRRNVSKVLVEYKP